MTGTNKISVNQVVKELPELEDLKVQRYTKPNQGGTKYLVTQHRIYKTFSLWKCVEDGLELINTGDDPLELEEKIEI